MAHNCQEDLNLHPAQETELKFYSFNEEVVSV